MATFAGIPALANTLIPLRSGSQSMTFFRKECETFAEALTSNTMNSTAMTELAARLAQFAAERDWDQFHSPKNLAMALVGEAGELAAEFQWMTEAQSQSPDAAQMARIRSEAADVLNYLARLADKLGIDLFAAAFEKILENERRYPVEKVRGSSKKYNEY